ncbi:MAG: helicase-associated domain-containing protein, partial [Planctomycetota bacterium]
RSEVPQYDTILRGRGDLMSDVVGALTFIRDAEVRVGKDGKVYKAARERMAEAFVFPLQPLIEREELGRRVLTMLQGLGLVETTADGHLALTAEGAEWSHKPLLQKVREAYDALCQEGQKTLRSRHAERLRQKLVELLAGDEQEAERNGEEPWMWGLSLAMRARNRYLIDLSGEKPSATPGDLAVRHGALTELGLLAQDLVLKLFFPLGLVDVAMRGDEAVAVRLSSLGRRLFSGEPEKDGEQPRPIIINPDFEMIVLPEGDVDDLLHALDRIAVRVKQDEVVHCRLDQQRVQRASVEGLGSDRILALLRDHSRAELPQNVEYSIRTWCQDVRSAKLERGILCTVSDPAVVDTILGHPTLKGCVARVVTPTTLFLNEKATEKKILQDLRALGVHVVV